MTNIPKLRPDGLPFHQDPQGRVPNYTLELSDSGVPIIVHQFTGLSAVLPQNYSTEDLTKAMTNLKERVKEQEK